MSSAVIKLFVFCAIICYFGAQQVGAAPTANADPHAEAKPTFFFPFPFYYYFNPLYLPGKLYVN